uniref:Protein kinase domain-containing protein n=1 Tax=Trypanosoma congolense (strain IL3000) TaxID=1068625 RepID=G0UZH0_TRYCI|nr:putative protein kinase [Trypanosoma congolense IL3000]
MSSDADPHWGGHWGTAFGVTCHDPNDGSSQRRQPPPTQEKHENKMARTTLEGFLLNMALPESTQFSSTSHLPTSDPSGQQILELADRSLSSASLGSSVVNLPRQKQGSERDVSRRQSGSQRRDLSEAVEGRGRYDDILAEATGRQVSGRLLESEPALPCVLESGSRGSGEADEGKVELSSTLGISTEPTSTSQRNSSNLPVDPTHGEAAEVKPRQYKFKIIKRLGAGGFGTVYQAMLSNGQLVAVKVMQMTSKPKAIDREVHVLSSLPPNPHCVRYLGSTRSRNHYYIIMEYISGGSIKFIRKSTGRFEEAAMQRCVKMVLEGLKHMHQHNIVHRDIKGDNVLLDEKGCAKIVDFGSCKVMNHVNSTLGGVGTPLWMAPEVCRGEPASVKSDVWGVGCLCLEMTKDSGVPWDFDDCSNSHAILYSIAGAKKPPSIPSHLSPLAQDFIASALKIHPEERPTVATLLEHPFFSQGYSDEESTEGNFIISREESIDLFNDVSTNYHTPPGIVPDGDRKACRRGLQPATATQNARPSGGELKSAIGGGEGDCQRGSGGLNSRNPILSSLSPDTSINQNIIGRSKKSTGKSDAHTRKGEDKELQSLQPHPNVVTSSTQNPVTPGPARMNNVQKTTKLRRSSEVLTDSLSTMTPRGTVGMSQCDIGLLTPLDDATVRRKKDGKIAKVGSERALSATRPSKEGTMRSSNNFSWWRSKQGSDSSKTVIKWLIK